MLGLGFLTLVWSSNGACGCGSGDVCYSARSVTNLLFLGGGIWHPEAGPIAAVRQSIDSNARGIKNVLLDDGIRKEFLSDAKKNDAAVVKAFAKSNADNALKSKPKVSILLFPPVIQVSPAQDPSYA